MEVQRLTNCKYFLQIGDFLLDGGFIFVVRCNQDSPTA